ncbi:hypothetical protein CKA32_006644 [Geitlerinema sp. FC II]|nr:hypothetical protein CKA32_006644 [Geitlerinema sp. FC II]
MRPAVVLLFFLFTRMPIFFRNVRIETVGSSDRCHLKLRSRSH